MLGSLRTYYVVGETERSNVPVVAIIIEDLEKETKTGEHKQSTSNAAARSETSIHLKKDQARWDASG